MLIRSVWTYAGNDFLASFDSATLLRLGKALLLRVGCPVSLLLFGSPLARSVKRGDNKADLTSHSSNRHRSSDNEPLTDIRLGLDWIRLDRIRLHDPSKVTSEMSERASNEEAMSGESYERIKQEHENN